MIYKIYAMANNDVDNYEELWGYYKNISDAQLALCDWEERFTNYIFTLVCEGGH